MSKEPEDGGAIPNILPVDDPLTPPSSPPSAVIRSCRRRRADEGGRSSRSGGVDESGGAGGDRDPGCGGTTPLGLHPPRGERDPSVPVAAGCRDPSEDAAGVVCRPPASVRAAHDPLRPPRGSRGRGQERAGRPAAGLATMRPRVLRKCDEGIVVEGDPRGEGAALASLGAVGLDIVSTRRERRLPAAAGDGSSYAARGSSALFSHLAAPSRAMTSVVVRVRKAGGAPPARSGGVPSSHSRSAALARDRHGIKDTAGVTISRSPATLDVCAGIDVSSFARGRGTPSVKTPVAKSIFGSGTRSPKATSFKRSRPVPIVLRIDSDDSYDSDSDSSPLGAGMEEEGGGEAGGGDADNNDGVELILPPVDDTARRPPSGRRQETIESSPLHMRKENKRDDPPGAVPVSVQRGRAASSAK